VLALFICLALANPYSGHWIIYMHRAPRVNLDCIALGSTFSPLICAVPHETQQKGRYSLIELHLDNYLNKFSFRFVHKQHRLHVSDKKWSLCSRVNSARRNASMHDAGERKKKCGKGGNINHWCTLISWMFTDNYIQPFSSIWRKWLHMLLLEVFNHSFDCYK